MGTARDVESGKESQPSDAQIQAARDQGLDVAADGKIGNVAGHGQLATDAYVSITTLLMAFKLANHRGLAS